MKTYLTILALLSVISFTSGYARAEMPTIRGSMERSLQYEREYQTNQMQRRMNQQYYNERLQGEIQQQQDDIYYLQKQEHMRNQGWGRPGLDGGVR